MEFGTALLLTGHKYCKMIIYIYIIQFSVLNPFKTTQDTIKLLETAYLLIFPCTGHPVFLHHIKISFHLTNQRNKLLEKGKIVHKVLESNMVVFKLVPCCSYFF